MVWSANCANSKPVSVSTPSGPDPVVGDRPGAVAVVGNGVVGPVAAVDRGVGATGAVERIVASVAGDRVVERIAGEGVGARAADEDDRVGSEQVTESCDGADPPLVEEMMDHAVVAELIDKTEP